MSLLRNSRTASVQVRGFASSPNLRVGPESPYFINVPQPIQPNMPAKRRVKGTLPVPRELFPPRRTDKPKKEYLDAVTPLPATERKVDPNSSDAENQEFKLKMATLRRKNLREGLQELHRRKQLAEKKTSERSLDSRRRRQRVLQQPDRDDVRFTRPSIVQAMKKTSLLPDSNLAENLALSKARLEAKQAQKIAERQEYLQSLYMNARTFITTEERLTAEIDKVFPEGENEAWRNDHRNGENIWNLGVPPTLQSMVLGSRKSEATRWDLIQDRVKKLGERITGGKM